MEFIDYDLGYLEAGAIVEVDLDAQANVILLNQSNFFSYKAGCSFNHYGGWAKRSPVRFEIPYLDHWHVCVDLGGYGGSVRTGIRVIKPEPPVTVVQSNLHYVLDDRAVAYFDKLSNGQFQLTDIVRDGMSRYHGNKVFNSAKELVKFCYEYDSSKY